MASRPFLMPQRGLLPGEAGKKLSDRFMDVTRPVQRGGIHLREHDGPSGDPGGASKMFHRPMDKRRALACFRALVHKVASVPEDQLWSYGLSSLRKFLTNIDRANKLDDTRSFTGRRTYSTLFWSTALLSGRRSYSTLLCPTAYL
jgi:hypothetical protein